LNLGTILSQPVGLLAARTWVRLFGNVLLQERYGVLHRSGYAYGLIRAAHVARYFGYRKVTACEFGVARGAGLLAMIGIAECVTRELGIGFRIVGFDTGVGLLEIQGYKDHPEIWSSGDFPMVDNDALIKAVGGRGELVFGDIENTVGPFVGTVTSDAPIGFVSVDVDVYTGARSALKCLTGKPESCTPAVSMYLADVGSFFANQWCGELAAIAEFNQEHALRKIDRDRSLPGSRPVRESRWYSRMYACHILDHEARNKPRPRGAIAIGEMEEHGFF
jgi:hypothetical protein